MAISSLDKIIHYINCVCLSDSIIEYEGTHIELKPVESVIILPNMWYKDECKCCGQCCRNYNTVFSDDEYSYLKTLDSDSHREYQRLQLDKVISVDGNDYIYHEVPPMNSKDTHNIYTDNGKALNCRWINLQEDGRKLCKIHTYRTITCGFPHMEFRRQKDSNTGYVGHLQFGRNNQLGCTVDIKAAPYDALTQEDDLYWLRRLDHFSSEYGIETLLPRVIECVENINLTNLPQEAIIISGKRRLF